MELSVVKSNGPVAVPLMATWKRSCCGMGGGTGEPDIPVGALPSRLMPAAPFFTHMSECFCAGDANGCLRFHLVGGEVGSLSLLVDAILPLFALDSQALLQVFHLNTLHVVDVLDVGFGLDSNGCLGHIACYRHGPSVSVAFLVYIDGGYSLFS